MTVLIAGAGPVGLTLATLLGQHDVPVIVFESGPTLNSRSQASTFHASTLELLDEIGMAWPLIDTGKISQRLQYRDRTDGLVAEFDFGVLRDVTRFPIRVQTNQSELTTLLRAEIAERYPSVTLRFNSQVIGAASLPDGASLLVEGPSGTTECKGRFAVGADGAHSVVRESAGIAFEGSSYESRHLMITTTYDVMGKMPELAPVTYVADRAEPVAVLVLSNFTRVVFMVSGPEPDEVVLGPENLQRRLAGFLPPEPDPYPVLDARIARLHQRVASSYVSGPLALAGDAAHLNHPQGGMGLNAGLHDAYVLGHTLRRIIREGADPDLLENYGRERREKAISYVLPAADGNSRDSEQASDNARRVRDDEMRAAAADPQRAFDFVYRASMFDSAPTRAGETTAT